jgi:hypothetical protein
LPSICCRYVVLIEVYEENLDSHTHVFGEKEEYFSSLSDNGRYSSVITTSKLAKL